MLFLHILLTSSATFSPSHILGHTRLPFGTKNDTRASGEGGEGGAKARDEGGRGKKATDSPGGKYQSGVPVVALSKPLLGKQRHSF